MTASTAHMSWRRLMSPQRLGVRQVHDDPRSEFEIDSDRITFTKEWRRAASKTQVHAPDPSGIAVRTRQSHSQEVAAVGRSLGQLAGRGVAARHRLAHDFAFDLAQTLRAAGLAHDLGNPPFGHGGEWAIARFFSDGVGAALIATLSERQQAEFTSCDGNAQGFRIVTRLTGWRPEGGLQLTSATLGALVKYPFQAIDSPKPPGSRKYGFYDAEAPLFHEVAERLGLPQVAGGAAPAWRRHPLVYLLEAADDLCYLIVDVVDAALVGDIGFRDALDLLRPLLPEVGSEFRDIPGRERRLEYLQAKAIGRLVKDCAQAFLDVEPQLLQGQQVAPLIGGSPVADQMRLISDVSTRRIYHAPRRMAREEAGNAVLGGLLDELAAALSERERAGDSVRLSRRSMEVLSMAWTPEDLVAVPYDRYGWMRSMVDVTMGMTDVRAARIALHLRPELSASYALACGDLAPETPGPGPDTPAAPRR